MNATIDSTHTARRRWMSVLARASSAEIWGRLAPFSPLPGFTCLRGPESGLAMLRGRTGGAGAPFNLGEMTVTRCTVRTDAGFTGHAYVAGRDARQAELAALVDALMQNPAHHDALEENIIFPLAQAQRERRNAIARKAAATRVEFFTMATMRTS